MESNIAPCSRVLGLQKLAQCICRHGSILKLTKNILVTIGEEVLADVIVDLFYCSEHVIVDPLGRRQNLKRITKISHDLVATSELINYI